MKSRIFREKQGFSSQFDEFLFAVRASGVEDFGDVPVVIRARGDEIAVHRPVVVFAEGETVGGVVVAAFGKRNQMCGINEGNILGGWEFDAQSAGGALVIVDGKDGASEGGGAAVFEFIFRDAGEGLMIVD